MRKVPFLKMTGAGNDFLVFDGRKASFKLSTWQIAWACNRNFGVGADGVLIVRPSRAADFRMQYFNADGSHAEMCGNGARCIARYAHELGVAGKQMSFETDAGLVRGEMLGKARVRVTLSDPRGLGEIRSIRSGAGTWKYVFVNTGVPHVVIPVSGLNTFDVVGAGRSIRTHRAFAPKGTNVNFIQKISSKQIRVRTYERGVEGETLACGTGVSAAAIAAVRFGWVKAAPVECLTQGGCKLTVDFELREGRVSKLSLAGPAETICSGKLEASC